MTRLCAPRGLEYVMILMWSEVLRDPRTLSLKCFPCS